jgi:hypothetical protein
MTIYLINLAITFALSLLKIVCLLVAIAYFTLAERKFMAAVQRRVGPNVVGPFGLLQPLADGLKLAGKELAVPAQASSRIFLTVSITVLLFALSGWAAIPFGMFDHSEYMSDEAVASILLLSDSSQTLFTETISSWIAKDPKTPKWMKELSAAAPLDEELLTSFYAEKISPWMNEVMDYYMDQDFRPFKHQPSWEVTARSKLTAYRFFNTLRVREDVENDANWTCATGECP